MVIKALKFKLLQFLDITHFLETPDLAVSEPGPLLNLAFSTASKSILFYILVLIELQTFLTKAGF